MYSSIMIDSSGSFSFSFLTCRISCSKVEACRTSFEPVEEADFTIRGKLGNASSVNCPNFALGDIVRNLGEYGSPFSEALVPALFSIISTALEEMPFGQNSSHNFKARATFESTKLIIVIRSEEHTSELQSRENLVCRLLLEKKK